MSRPDLAPIQSALRTHYGRPEIVAADNSAWQRLAALLADSRRGSSRARRMELEGLLAALDSPADVAGLSVAELQHLLEPYARAKDVPALLKRLAQWWTETFSDDRDPQWKQEICDAREQLGRIRGLGPERVDRILLQVFGLPVFPAGRAVQRIALRHGWFDSAGTDDEWQDLFVSGWETSELGLGEFHELLTRAGSEFCGTVPQCDTCPLKAWLPDSGPLSLERD